MKFQTRKGISPIIATLLLIAIAVAAAIVVYVFVTGLAGNLTTGGGQQTTERLQMQSFNFVISPGVCACSGQIIQIFLVNSGPSSTAISAVYYDGVITGLPGTAPAVDFALGTLNAYTLNAASTIIQTAGAGNIHFGNTPAVKTSYAAGDVGQVVVTLSAAATAGTSHTVKVVSTTGATFIFSVTAGRSG